MMTPTMTPGQKLYLRHAHPAAQSWSLLPAETRCSWERDAADTASTVTPGEKLYRRHAHPAAQSWSLLPEEVRSSWERDAADTANGPMERETIPFNQTLGALDKLREQIEALAGERDAALEELQKCKGVLRDLQARNGKIRGFAVDYVFKGEL